MLTCGACNALNISAMGLLDPGEEVLVLTPCWPFFPGMVRLAGGVVVEAPFYSRLYQAPDLDIAEYLERFITPKTAALYLNTPNNPSGKVLNRTQLEAVADLVQRHHLWLLSDEAYDGMTFDGRAHHSIASFPGMFERTLSIFTFSKVYMFAGLRLGYIAAPERFLKQLNKMMVHQLYSPSTLAQQMMVEPVRTRETWHRDFVNHCQELRGIVSDHLRIDHHARKAHITSFFRSINISTGGIIGKPSTCAWRAGSRWRRGAISAAIFAIISGSASPENRRSG